MAAVATFTPKPHYSRRVSFNNLVQGGPVEKSPYITSPTEREKPINVEPLAAFFGNYSMSGKPAVPSISYRKTLRLPDPPSRSILKNKLSPTQLSSNITNAVSLGVSYHGDINDLVSSPLDVPRLELAKIYILDPNGNRIEDGSNAQVAQDNAIQNKTLEDSAIDDDEDLMSPTEAPKFKRPSFSGMTDEELLALDPQFANHKTSDLNSFKFNSTSTFYPTARRNSTTTSTSPTMAKQVFYPSLNENNYKSVSLTVKHNDFDEVAFPRTILTVLSGRRHTWNSLDWLLLIAEDVSDIPCFLQDGDHLVVSGLIPLKFLDQNQDRRRNSTLSCVEAKIQQKCESLLEYIMLNLPADLLRLKVTVELVLDVTASDPMALSQQKNKNVVKTGTKFMIDHLFKQYQPVIIVMGNKSTNLNFKYPKRIKKTLLAVPSVSGNALSITHRGSVSGPQRHSISGPSPSQTPNMSKETDADEYLIKLTSYLIKYAPVPVVLVGNATQFHVDFKKQSIRPPEKSGVTFAADLHDKYKARPQATEACKRKNSAISDISIESFNGNEERSLSSTKQTSLDSSPSLPEKVQDILESPGEDRFLRMMQAISDQSLSESNEYLGKVKSDTLSGDLLGSRVHQVYSSMSQGRQNGLLKSTSGSSSAYKVKSLISYDPEEEKRNEKLIKDKKLRKSTSRGSLVSSKLDTKVVQKKKSFLQKIGIKKS